MDRKVYQSITTEKGETIDIYGAVMVNMKLSGRTVKIYELSTGNVVLGVENLPESGRTGTTIHLTKESFYLVFVAMSAFIEQTTKSVVHVDNDEVEKVIQLITSYSSTYETEKH